MIECGNTFYIYEIWNCRLFVLYLQVNKNIMAPSSYSGTTYSSTSSPTDVYLLTSDATDATYDPTDSRSRYDTSYEIVNTRFNEDESKITQLLEAMAKAHCQDSWFVPNNFTQKYESKTKQPMWKNHKINAKR